MRITNGEEIAGQQSFYPTHLGKVTLKKIIGTLVALSWSCVLMGPISRTVYLLDVVMGWVDLMIVIGLASVYL